MGELINKTSALADNIIKPIAILMLFLFTVIFFLVSVIPEDKSKMSVRLRIKKQFLKFINLFIKPYKLLIYGQPFHKKVLYFVNSIFIVALALVIDYSNARDKFNSYIIIILYTTFLTIIMLIITYIALSIIVVSFEFVVDYIEKTKNKIRNIIASSLFIPFIYLMFMLSKQINIRNIFVQIIICTGILYSHYLAFKGLMICIKEPNYITASHDKNIRIDKYKALFAWLIIILLVLFCEVVFISKVDNNSFVSNQIIKNNNILHVKQVPVTNYFDLFYFTIVTFATVGYGDIIPGNLLGKISSILIIFSGMLFLIIFVSIIISNKFSSRKNG